MQETTDSMYINSLTYYACGYCKSNMGLVLKKHGKDVRNFSAGVFLINHKELGYILVDTGYAHDMQKQGIKSKLYKLFNPTYCNKNDEISSQLLNDNINTSVIKYIILTHLHPDHIGNLKAFSNAKIIISDEAYKEYHRSKLRDLIFKELLPNDFENRLQIINFNNKEEYGLFDDINLIKMNGHSKGQIGILLKEEQIFLAGDSCWGRDLLVPSKSMNFIGKMIQNDMNEYKKSIEYIEKMIDNGMTVYFSHDKIDEKELL